MSSRTIIKGIGGARRTEEQRADLLGDTTVQVSNFQVRNGPRVVATADVKVGDLSIEDVRILQGRVVTVPSKFELTPTQQCAIVNSVLNRSCGARPLPAGWTW